MRMHWSASENGGVNTDSILKEILENKGYFDQSKGGVTFSGGECMLQPDALTELLKGCQAAGVHTAVDTAGNVLWESFEQVLPYTDLFLYDIKAMDSEWEMNGFWKISQGLRIWERIFSFAILTFRA